MYSYVVVSLRIRSNGGDAGAWAGSSTPRSTSSSQVSTAAATRSLTASAWSILALRTAMVSRPSGPGGRRRLIAST